MLRGGRLCIRKVRLGLSKRGLKRGASSDEHNGQIPVLGNRRMYMLE